MLSPKENLLETIRRGGHPERLPVCFTPFRPIGGDPVFQFVRGNRVRGTNSYDRWGTTFPFRKTSLRRSPSSRRRTR